VRHKVTFLDGEETQRKQSLKRNFQRPHLTVVAVVDCAKVSTITWTAKSQKDLNVLIYEEGTQ
jgi:hypothetical protein